MKKIYFPALIFYVFLFVMPVLVRAQVNTQTFTTVGTSTWTCPTGVTSVTVQCWGGGGGGGGVATTSNVASGGGAGGSYSSGVVTVTPATTYSLVVGAGGTAGANSGTNGATGGSSSFNSTSIIAVGGPGGTGGTAAGSYAGGTGTTSGNVGTTTFAGGNGSVGTSTLTGGGGGGGAGDSNPGGNASGATAGAGGTTGGGNGGAGVSNATGNTGTAPGGGGSGTRRTTTNRAGGAGARGQVIISYTLPSPTVENFSDQIFCTNTYPTSYNTVNFSLVETSEANFGASQTNVTIVFTLPAGFQFNTAVNPTVSANGAITQDITIGGRSITATALTVTVTTDGTPNCLDEINVIGAQIQATTAGSSGDLVRSGGTLLVNSSASIPSNTTSFGHLATSTPSVFNSASVSQYSTASVIRGCTTNPSPILEIAVNVTGGYCTPHDVITQFVFSTAGTPGCTNAATDITKAEVYYSDTTQGFSNANYFGSVASPSGTFTITGSQGLGMGPGPYYFYLVYTVPGTATVGDVLDASLSSFVFNGTTINSGSITTPDPAGSRTITSGTCVSTPDIAPPTANTQTLTVGSLIIPMDNTHQVSGGLFNLKSYGLVHALLNNDIPVKWIIKSGKAKDAADFTANVSSYAPTTGTTVTAETFTASAFAVDSYYVSHAYYSGGMTAAQVISSYTSSVQVYQVKTSDVAVDVRYTLNHRPKIAIFSNGGFQAVQVGYMTAAGITNYFVQNAGDFTGLAECYTFCSESHWDYSSNPDTRPVQRVVDFVNEGGNFLAQCAGIDLYENHQPLGGHFQTTNGVSFANAGGANSTGNPDMAYSQCQGTITHDAGTIAQYWLAAGSSYKPETFSVTSTGTNTLAASAAHLGNPDSTGYNVFYLAGHNYSTTSNPDINGIRLYLNATLIPAGRPTAFPLVVTSPVTICAGQTVAIGPSTCNSTATYQWGPSTGLSSSSVCNPIASPTTTTTYSVVGFQGGCIMGPTSMTVMVNPTPVMTSTNAASICSNGTVSIPLTANMASTYQWIAADNPNTSGESLTTQTTATLSNTIVNTTTSAQTVVYTVTPTSTTGTCTGTPQIVTVTVNPAPSMTSASTATICSGSAVSIPLTANMGGATFTWIATDNPNTTGESTSSQSTATLSNTITNNTTSTQTVIYTVTPTAGGCTGTAQTVTVTVNPTPTATVAPNSVTICSGGTTSLTLTSNVGSTAFTWSVSQSGVTGASAGSGTLIAQTLNATSASAGTATYTITPAAGGCSGTDVTAIVTVNPIPTVTASPTSQSICSGSASNITLTSTTPGATFAWTVTQTNVTGASASSGTVIAQTLNASTTSAGTAVYTITPSAGTCSGSAITATVTVNPIPSATASPTSQSICSLNTTTVALSSNVAGTTYSWTVTQTNVTGATSSSGTVIAQTLTATTSSAGTAVYTITPTANSCSGSAITATVTVNPAPSVTATPTSQTICSGGASNIALTSSTGGATFNWTVTQTNVSGASAGSGTVIAQTLNATSTSAGTAVYTITPSAGGCAGAPITATVTVNPIPSATATPTSQTLCSGSTTTVTLSSNVAGTTFNWTVTQTNVSGASASSGTVISQALTASSTSAGTAVYTITPTAGTCNGTALTSTITVNPIPSATATPSSQSICSLGTTTVNLASNVAGTTFNWTVTQTNVTGASASSGATIAQTLTATTASAGTAIYTITPTANSCAGTPVTATVTVNPAPSVTATPSSQSICSGNATNIALTSGTGGTTFAWTVTQSGVSGASASSGTVIAQTLSATGASPGTASYTITPTAAGCSGSPIVVTVTVNPIPSATATPSSQSICSLSTTTVNLTSNVAGTTFNWTVTQTNVTGASASSGATIAQTLTATTASAGTAVYTITPTANTCAGSPITATVTVNPAPSVTATPSSQSICSGNATNIALTSGTGGTTFAWTVSQSGVSGASASTGTVIAQTLSATGSSPGTATYTITPSAAGCSGAPIIVTVTVNPIPSATATPSSQSICSLNTTTVNLTSNVAGTTFNWTVTQSNVTGASASSGTLIAQTLTATTASAGTAVYTITPTANSCAGSPITATVTVNPAPSVTATPSSQTICSGSASNIALTSSTGGATFNWTVTQTNVTGATAGSGTVIAQTLNASTTSAGTAVYTITPSAGGCAGAPITATVTTNPIPSATATPSSQTLCSGSATSVTLTSNVGSTTYSWTVSQSGTSGAANGSGSTITQTLTATGVSSGTATYTITPTAGGCSGSAITVPISVNPVPTATATPNSQTFCSGNTSSIALTSNVAGAGFTWTVTQTNVSGASAGSGTSIAQTISTTGTSQGTAVYTITPSASGCNGTAITVTVTVNPIPAMTSASSATICGGQTVNIPLTSNVASTYTWIAANNPNTTGESTTTQTTSIINNTLTETSGNTEVVIYTVTPTSTGGSCAGSSQTVSVTVSPTPILTVTPTSQTLCSGNTTSISLSSNVAGTSYTWTVSQSGVSGAANGSGSSIAQTLSTTGTSPGTATYTISPTIGSCTGASLTATVTVNPVPAMTSANSATICSGGTVNIPLTANVASNFTWIAADNTNTTGESTTTQNTSTLNNTIINSTTSVQTVIYTVMPTSTAGSCAGASLTVTVTVNPVPAMTSANTATICSGGTVSIPLTSNVASTYTWIAANNANTTGESLTTQSTGTLSNTIANSTTIAQVVVYTVTPTSTGGSCAGTSQTVSVTVNPTPAMTSSTSATICSGNTLNIPLTANVASNFSWITTNNASTTGESTTPQNTSTINDAITNTTASVQTLIYTVTPTSTGGSCAGTAQTVTVTVNPTPNMTSASSATICSGQTVSIPLTSNVPSNFTWIATDNPNTTGESTTTQSTNTLSNTLTETTGNTEVVVYTVTPTSTGGSCPGTPQTVSVTVSPTPILTVTPTAQTLCSGNTTSINLSSNVTGTTYTWTVTQTGVSGASGATGSAITQTLSTTGVTSGTAVYTITPTIGSCSGTSLTATVTVNPVPSATATPSSQTLCSGSATSIALTSNVASTNFFWTVSQSGVSGASNGSGTTINQLLTATGVTQGIANYTVTPTASGCSGTPIVVSVSVNPTPTSTATPSSQALCSGNAATIALSSNVAGANFAWSIAQSGVSGASNGSGLSITHTLTTTGAVPGTVTYTITPSASGCSGTPIVATVTVNPIPTAPSASSNSPVCITNPINLSAGNVTGATYSWSGPNGFTSTLQNPSIPNAAFTDAGTYSVNVTVNGCTGPNQTVTVVVNTPPPSNLTPSANTPVCTGQTLTLTIGSISSASYNWSGPNTFTSSAQNPTITSVTAAAAGVYTVSATVPGCAASGSGTVSVAVNVTPSAPTASNNGPLCVGDSLQLNSAGTGTSFNWSGPSGFSNTNQNTGVGNITAANAGVYSVTTTANGCTSLAGTTTVVINPIPATPTVSSNSPLCVGATLNLSTPAVTGATYSWSGPNGFSASTQNPTQPSVTTADAGTYSLTETVNGCTSASGTVAVAVNTAPGSPTAGSNSPVCAGDTLFLTASNIGGAVYSWSGPNGFNSSQQNPMITPVTAAAAGTYTVIANNGCASTPATTTVTVNPSPSAPTIGNNSPVCQGSTLTFTASTVGGATYNWSGPNGFTDASQNPSIPNAQTTDAGTYTLTITVAGCNSPAITTTASVNLPAITAVSGSQTVCANNPVVAISGTVTGGSTTGTWSSTGTGTFSPSNTALSSTYTPSNADTAAGNIILTLTSTNNGACAASVSSLTLTITDAPGASAGANQSVCANNSTINLNGTVSGGAGGGTWTTSGSGTFSPDANALNAAYTPSAADISAGVVTFTLTTTGVGQCNAVSSVMSATITTAPTVNAGPDQVKCKSSLNSALNGTVTVTNSGVWSTSGSGSFAPNANTLNATYTPSSADTAAGSVFLILTSANNGGCTPVTDTLKITYTDIPVVNAGPDQTVCANNINIALNGNVTLGSTTGAWSTSGTGTFTPNNTTLNANYVPSTADTAAGTVTLTLTSTGGCVVVTDNLVVTITDAPGANAGADISACSNNPDAIINGSVSGATNTGIWSSTGSGTFNPSNTSLSGTYVPSGADVSAGSVFLILTSTSNGSCNAAVDSLKLTFTPPPTAFAGNDASFCANATYTLSGSITGGAGTGAWTTSGSGTFNPNANTLNATYIPSNADTAAGSVTLTLASTNNGGCLAATDQVVLTITDGPSINAGADQSVCSNNNVVTLNGSVSVSSGVSWSTLGDGTFGSATSNSTTYTPGTNDMNGGSATIVIASTGNGGCIAVTDTMKVTIQPAPITNAGSDQFICTGTNTVNVSGFVSGITSTGTWSTLGTGTFNAPNSLGTVYNLSPADTLTGSVLLVLSSTNNGSCNPATDTVKVTITPAGFAAAGNDTTVCGNVTSVPLAGIITGGSGSGQWTTSGTGTFTPNNTTLNATYSPSAADISAGTVTIKLSPVNSCNPTNDSLVITIDPVPVVNAGSDQFVCATSNTVALNGSVNTGSGTWTTMGSGTFAPNASTLNAVYSFSATDSTAGSVNLVLTSGNNASCSAVSDTVKITITSTANALAGNDTNVCSNVAAVTLAGIINGGTGQGQWSTSGTGTFAPDNTTLNASYSPSAADITAGSVVLTLTPTNACQPTADSLVLTLSPAPVVNAGSDQFICATTNTVALNGSVTTGSATWTTLGSGTFAPSASILNAVYTLSIADSTAGTVSLVLTSGNNGSCNAVTDTMKITLTTTANALAGNDTTICSNVDSLHLAGIINGGTGQGHWSTNGTGTFSPDSTTLNAWYVPGAADVTAGSVMLTLTPINACSPAADSLVLTIAPAPVVNAGVDQFVCTSTNTVALNGTVTGGSTTGNWTTLGSGTFSPSAGTLNGVYTLSAADSIAGNVTLVLTSTGGGICGNLTDTMKIFTTTSTAAVAGVDTSICSNDSLALNGSIIGGSAGQWSSNGTGTFSPNNTALNATYHPSAADIAAGNVTLVLAPTNGCQPTNDSLILTFNAAPVVSAGSNSVICASTNTVALNGSVTGGSTTGMWSSSGTGSFAPNATTLNAVYTLSTSDSTTGSVTLLLTSTNNGSCGAVKDSITITLSSPASAQAGANTSVCANNASVVLGGTITGGSGQGQWTTSGSGSFAPADTILNAIYVPSGGDITNGTVTLILTPANSCAPVSDSIVVSITPAPTVNAGTDTTICGTMSPITLGGSKNTVSTGAIWTVNGSGTFSPNDSTLNATYTSAASDNDTLIFTLTSSGNGQCLAVSDTMRVIRIVKPTADFVYANLCMGQSAAFTDSSKGNVSTWAWNFGGGNTSVLQNPTFNFTASGTYTVTLHVSGATGCDDSVTKTINIHPAPVASFSLSNLCFGDSVRFTDGSSIAPGSINSWNWNFGDGNNSSQQNPVHHFDSVKVYTVSLAVVSDSGCSSTATQTVQIHSSPLAGFTTSSSCGSLAVNFNDTSNIVSPDSITVWSWNFGDTHTSTQQDPANTYGASGTYTVLLQVQTSAGCTDTARTVVNLGSNLTAAYIPAGGTYNTGQNIDFTNQSINGTSYDWTFGDNTNSTVTDPAHAYSQPGSYTVTLVASNALGCTDTASYVFEIQTQGVTAPTGFTPDGDGLNDYFYIMGGPFTSYDLHVYNEWGNEIFMSTSQSDKWDGTYKGVKQPAGTFIYIFKGVTINGHVINWQKEINLIR